MTIGGNVISNTMVAEKKVEDKKNQEVKQLLTGHYSADVDSNPYTTEKSIEVNSQKDGGKTRFEKIKTTVVRNK
jgi:hypothetical protein